MHEYHRSSFCSKHTSDPEYLLGDTKVIFQHKSDLTIIIGPPAGNKKCQIVSATSTYTNDNTSAYELQNDANVRYSMLEQRTSFPTSPR